MKERPILFSGPMVRALLAGTKTQTRRVVKAKHLPWLENSVLNFLDGKWNQRPLPYGKPGDRLWVRETWRTDARLDDKAPNAFSGWPVKYEADSTALNHGAFFGQTDGKTRVSIHMPRWASRITLEITGVRVERLHDISEADAQAEGTTPIPDPCDHVRLACADIGCSGPQPYRVGFRALWQDINGPGSWDGNPWVWVVEFRRLP